MYYGQTNKKQYILWWTGVFRNKISSLLSSFILNYVNIEWQNDGSIRFISFLAQWIRREMFFNKSIPAQTFAVKCAIQSFFSSCKNCVHTLFCQKHGNFILVDRNQNFMNNLMKLMTWEVTLFHRGISMLCLITGRRFSNI